MIRTYYYPWYRRVWAALRRQEYVQWCDNPNCACSYRKAKP